MSLIVLIRFFFSLFSQKIRVYFATNLPDYYYFVFLQNKFPLYISTLSIARKRLHSKIPHNTYTQKWKLKNHSFFRFEFLEKWNKLETSFKKRLKYIRFFTITCKCNESPESISTIATPRWSLSLNPQQGQPLTLTFIA